jgi:hypothetical protein
MRRKKHKSRQQQPVLLSKSLAKMVWVVMAGRVENALSSTLIWLAIQA